MKRCSTTLFIAILLVGCESDPNFWNPETCNGRLESDTENLEEYQEKFKEAQERMEYFARSGDSERAATHQQSAENWKRNAEQLLTFVDTELTDLCGRGVFRPELMEKVEASRKFFEEDAIVQTFETEEMPNLRVTNIQSTFIPYELDERGACSGPYIDLKFIISNQGGDFPRPIDLQTMEERTKTPLEKLLYFTLVYDLDFGSHKKVSQMKTVDRSNFAGSVFPSGGTYELPVKLRVESDEQHARITAKVVGGGHLKAGSHDFLYETDIDIPIWDVYTQSNTALKSINEGGQLVVKTKTDITNNGRSETPGPVHGNFTIQLSEDGPTVVSWDGDTGAPVAPGGVGYILKETTLTREWTDTFIVQSLVYPLCPGGTYGSLSDGNTENNSRVLRQ